MKAIYPMAGEDPLHLLWRCGGWYHQVAKPDGSFDGPLVGYAKKYKDGEIERQMVGRVYCNFAKLERHAAARTEMVRRLHEAALARDVNLGMFTGFCGAPEGGKALAVSLSDLCRTQYIFPEKVLVADATADARAKHKLGWGRHEPEEGERWVMVEDTSNFMSTPAELGALIEEKGAEPVALVCFLNRSQTIDSEVKLESGRVIPVIAVVRRAMDSFRQDDLSVAAQIAAHDVVFDVKKEWRRIAPFIGEFVAP